MAEGPLPWPGGVSALPPFASAANRNLADDIDAKKQQLDALRARAADQAARDTRMAAYAERVKAENAEARRLVDVRRRGIETEVDRQRDADAEGRRLARDMAQFSTGLRTAEVQVRRSPVTPNQSIAKIHLSD